MLILTYTVLYVKLFVWEKNKHLKNIKETSRRKKTKSKAENPSIRFFAKQTTKTSQLHSSSFSSSKVLNFYEMSDSIHRRKVPNLIGNGGRSSRTRRTVSRYISDKNTRSNSINRVFERSFSEPSLNRRRDGDSNYLRQLSPMRGLPTEESDPIVNLTRIRSEVFASFPSLSDFSSPSSPSPINQEVRVCFVSLIFISIFTIFKSNS